MEMNLDLVMPNCDSDRQQTRVCVHRTGDEWSLVTTAKLATISYKLEELGKRLRINNINSVKNNTYLSHSAITNVSTTTAESFPQM